MSVNMLSDRDAVTLAGGIAVFAVSISAWFAVTTALVVHLLRHGRAGQAKPPADRLHKVERLPLVNR